MNKNLTYTTIGGEVVKLPKTLKKEIKDTTGDLFKQSNSIKAKLEFNKEVAFLQDAFKSVMTPEWWFSTEFEGANALYTDKKEVIKALYYSSSKSWFRFVDKVSYNITKLFMMACNSAQNKSNVKTKDFKDVRVKINAHGQYKDRDMTCTFNMHDMITVLASKGLIDESSYKKTNLCVIYFNREGEIKQGKSYVTMNIAKTYEDVLKKYDFSGISAVAVDKKINKALTTIAKGLSDNKGIYELYSNMEYDLEKAKKICKESIGTYHKGELVTEDRVNEWLMEAHLAQFNYSYLTQRTGRRTISMCNVPSKLRCCFTYKGQNFWEVDAKNSQPTLLAGLLRQKGIECNQFVKDVEDGVFYEEYGKLMGVSDRSVAKTLSFRDVFFGRQMMNRKVEKALTSRYGVEFVDFLKSMKLNHFATKEELKQMKESKNRQYDSELWFNLQSLEADIWNSIFDSSNVEGYQIYDAQCVIGKDNAEMIAQAYKDEMYNRFGINAQVTIEELK